MGTGQGIEWESTFMVSQIKGSSLSMLDNPSPAWYQSPLWNFHTTFLLGTLQYLRALWHQCGSMDSISWQPEPASSLSQARCFSTPAAPRLIFFCAIPQVERLHAQGVPVLAVKAAQTRAAWWLLSDVSALCAEMTSRHHMQTGSSKQAREKI